MERGWANVGLRHLVSESERFDGRRIHAKYMWPTSSISPSATDK